MAPVTEMLLGDPHRLSGRGGLRIAVDGTLGAPRYVGTARLEGGRYENLLLGTVLTELNATAVADESGTMRIDIAALDGGEGRVTANGDVALTPELGVPARLDVKIAQATLLRRDELTAVANGRIEYWSTTDGATISGLVEMAEIEARPVSRLPPSVVDLGVVEAGMPDPAAGPEAPMREELPAAVPAPAPPADGIAFDVTVTVPARGFVRGRGLDSEWAGEVRITGTTTAPEVVGQLRVVRGRYTLAGKAFVLTPRSSVTFDDGKDIDPLLDIEAEHNTGELTAIVYIAGRASAPRVGLESRPTLPQDEIMARVLFGKSAARLGALEAVQMAEALASLSGASSASTGVFDFARTLGVDVLNVGAAEGGAEVTAGRYMTDRAFVGITQGTVPGTTAVTVEVELMPNITLVEGSERKSPNWDSVFCCGMRPARRRSRSIVSPRSCA